MPIALLAQLLCAEKPPPHPTPGYLPRTGSAALFVQSGSVSLATRLGWELDLVDQPRNTLVLGFQLGAAYSLSLNFWQYVALLGLGYRMQRQVGFHWGFDVGAGPAIFGDQRERRALPYIEGRVHAGWRFEPVTIALCGGYAQWIARDTFSTIYLNLGGWFVGALIGWK